MPFGPLFLALAALAPQDRSLLDWVRADAQVVAEVPDPAATWDRLQAGEPWRRFLAGPLYAELHRRPEFLLAQGLWNRVAATAAVEASELLPAVAGGGAAWAVLPGEPPSSLFLWRALEPSVAQDALQAIAEVAAAGLDLPDLEHWRQPLPQGLLERRGDLFLFAAPAAAADALPEAPAKAIGALAEFVQARAAVPPRDAFLWVAGSALAAKPIPERPEDANGSFLAAPLHAALRSAPWAAAALAVDERGVRAAAALAAPAELRQSHAPYFPPARAIALPRLEQPLGSLVFARDLGAWWTGRDRYLSAAALAGTVDDDGNASTLFGRDYGTEVLAYLEPEIRLVFARNPDPTPVAVEFPAGALGLRLRADAPADLKDAFPGAWMALLTIVNFADGSASRDPLLQDVESLPDGTKLYSARYRAREASASEPAPARHQLTPALALRPDGELWLSSSTPLLRALLAAPTEAFVLEGDALALQLACGRPILRADRAALIAQRMLQNGGDEASAAVWFERLSAALELLDGISLQQRLEDGYLRYQLELTADAAR